MIFGNKDNIEKTVLVISDIHLGAGRYVDGRKNYLEDFHSDQEMVEFLEHYSSGSFQSKEVELVINGDFLDFLAVPFVKFFDDEFWSEKAALEKLRLILDAHKEVIEALAKFATKKNHKVIYIIGNHDAELVFKKVQTTFVDELKKYVDDEIHFEFLVDIDNYSPHPSVMIMHGHQYEIAHNFKLSESLITSKEGEKYFLPPWGSYYVTRVINRFKEERAHINCVRPIKTFLIYGLIFDTLFTIRFMLANAFYFIMVRFLHFFKHHKNIKVVVSEALKELELFQDFEMITREFFEDNPKVKTLIVGHTHDPSIRQYADGSTFINTGTWTKMINLDFAKMRQGLVLTYAKIDIKKGNELFDSNLLIWKGKHENPYHEFL